VLEIEVDKNEGIREILTSQNISSLFSVSDAERCQIEQYSLHRTNDILIAPVDELYGILNVANRVNPLAAI
jgi:hypothetical protein